MNSWTPAHDDYSFYNWPYFASKNIDLWNLQWTSDYISQA